MELYVIASVIALVLFFAAFYLVIKLATTHATKELLKAVKTGVQLQAQGMNPEAVEEAVSNVETSEKLDKLLKEQKISPAVYEQKKRDLIV